MAKNTRTGRYKTTSVAGEKVKAFVPSALPFSPALEMEHITPLLEKANHTLGQLDSATSLLPDTSLLIYFYVRKEALLSSQIEGTQSSFDDLLFYESGSPASVPVDDVEEVSHYVAGLQHGLKRMHEELPLSLRLMKEIHAILLRGGRGSSKQPGEFRSSQNWIGGTRPGNAAFVPPPPDQLMDCLGNLELYLHDHYGKIPTLLKAAIAHVQFETIHPFLDGNGRLGRLLITLLLCAEDILQEPVLYLSLYLKKHRSHYYDLLNRVRTEGVWEEWVIFFLEGVIETANEALKTTKEISALFTKDKATIEQLKRPKESALKVFHYLQTKAICSIPQTSEALSLSQPTVTASLKHLEKLGIVKPLTEKKRDRLFGYSAYLELLGKDTAPIR
jgi:Fic family protein